MPNDNEVLVSVRTELQKLLDELNKVTAKNKEVQDEFKSSGQAIDDSLKKKTQSTTQYFFSLRDVGRRVFDQLKSDIKALASLRGLEAGLSLSNQFSGTFKEVLSLSDSVRRLGNSFGIAKSDFSKFQGALSKGFGDIGASSEEAANALQGLTGTGVKGQGNVLEYAKTAAQLGMLSGERGKSGDIAGSLAGVVRAQGKDVNDPEAMRAIAREVTAASKATGKGASELLREMQNIFESMPEDLRKSFSPKAISQLGVASVVGGPGAADALKAFLGKSKEERAGLEAQGFGKIFGKDGELDLKGLQEVAKELKSRGVSSRMAAQTLGLSGSEAEGFVRLIEKSDQLAQALDETSKASKDYAKEARESMGFGDAFRANIRKVQGTIGEGLGAVTQGATDLLSSASESSAGALGTVAAGGILASVLAGGGLRGIGGSLAKGAGGLIKGKVAEGVTEKETIPVYVVNASEIGGGGSALAGAGKMGGLAKGALGVAGAGAIGYEVGSLINEGIVEKTQGKTSEGFEGNAIERLFFKLDKLFGNERATQFERAQQMMNVKVEVTSKSGELKASTPKTRGASN